MNAIAQATPAPVTGPALDNRRVLAALIDLAVIFAVGFVLGAVIGGGDPSPAFTGIILGWALYYYFACESGAGQTLGKKVMKLRVVRADGSPAGMREIAVRTVLRLVDGIGLYLVGLVAMLITGDRRQRLGDLAAGTIVTEATPPEPVDILVPAATPLAAVPAAPEAPVADPTTPPDATTPLAPAPDTPDAPDATTPLAPVADATTPLAPAADATTPLAPVPATEDAVAEPVAAVEEPVVEEPASLATVEPVPAEDPASPPAVEPVAAEDSVSPSADKLTTPLADKVLAGPSPAGLAAVEPVVEKPAVVRPAPVEPVVEEPAVVDPAPVELAAVEPVAEEPGADDSAQEPAAQAPSVKGVETVSAIDLVMADDEEPQARPPAEPA